MLADKTLDKICDLIIRQVMNVHLSAAFWEV